MSEQPEGLAEAMGTDPAVDVSGEPYVDLEREAVAYQHKLSRARDAQSRGLYREAMESAVSAWEHIDGMMQYGRRYEDAEFDRIKLTDLVGAGKPVSRGGEK